VLKEKRGCRSDMPSGQTTGRARVLLDADLKVILSTVQVAHERVKATEGRRVTLVTVAHVPLAHCPRSVSTIVCKVALIETTDMAKRKTNCSPACVA